MNMQQIMKQAQKMQKRMEEVQEDLAKEVVEASAGGGMVKVMISGQQEIVAVEIEKEIVDPEEVEMLEDLVIAAVNEAIKKSKALMEERMKSAAGGLNIPGMF